MVEELHYTIELGKKLSTTIEKLDALKTSVDSLDNRINVETNPKLDTLNTSITNLNALLVITNRRLTTSLQQDVTLWRINNNGDVIFTDSFEGDQIHWQTGTAIGGTVTREYGAGYVFHQNASIRLSITNEMMSRAWIEKYFPVPNNLTGVGFELAFMSACNEEGVQITARVDYFNGTYDYMGLVHYLPYTRLVQVFGTGTLYFYPKVNRPNLCWNKVKFTCDFANNTFKDLWFNDITADISGLGLSYISDETEPTLRFNFDIRNAVGTVNPWNCYVDDFILSVNEPKVF